MKRLILVTSPPASGKTYISKKLAENLKHVVYLDKDTLIGLSNVVFDVAGQERNRSSDFFEEHIRNAEYDVIIALAMEALQYENTVLINAPFTREVRNPQYIRDLKQKLKKKNAVLNIVWVQTDLAVCKERMIRRNSDRDGWKIAHWDEYVATRDFSVPQGLEDLLLFKNSSDKEYKESMKRLLRIFEK